MASAAAASLEVANCFRFWASFLLWGSVLRSQVTSRPPVGVMGSRTLRACCLGAYFPRKYASHVFFLVGSLVTKAAIRSLNAHHQASGAPSPSQCLISLPVLVPLFVQPSGQIVHPGPGIYPSADAYPCVYSGVLLFTEQTLVTSRNLSPPQRCDSSFMVDRTAMRCCWICRCCFGVNYSVWMH